MEIVSDLGGNDQQRWTGYEHCSGNCDDYGYVGDDQRHGCVDGDGGSFELDCGNSRHGVGGGGEFGAIHRDRDLQRRLDSEPDDDGELDIVGDFGRND